MVYWVKNPLFGTGSREYLYKSRQNGKSNSADKIGWQHLLNMPLAR
jgi:hypothetical protein